MTKHTKIFCFPVLGFTLSPNKNYTVYNVHAALAKNTLMQEKHIDTMQIVFTILDVVFEYLWVAIQPMLSKLDYNEIHARTNKTVDIVYFEMERKPANVFLSTLSTAEFSLIGCYYFMFYTSSPVPAN